LAPLWMGQPILAPQAVDTVEFPQVTGDDNQASASGMAGNQDIISANRKSLAVEHSSNIAGMRRRFRPE